MQNEFLAEIKTIEDAKRFVNKVSTFETEIDVRQGRYTVAGSSLLGIFSLDLTKPIFVVIQSHNGEEITKIYHELEEFEIESIIAESRDTYPSRRTADLNPHRVMW